MISIQENDFADHSFFTGFIADKYQVNAGGGSSTTEIGAIPNCLSAFRAGFVDKVSGDIGYLDNGIGDKPFNSNGPGVAWWYRIGVGVNIVIVFNTFGCCTFESDQSAGGSDKDFPGIGVDGYIGDLVGKQWAVIFGKVIDLFRTVFRQEEDTCAVGTDPFAVGPIDLYSGNYLRFEKVLDISVEVYQDTFRIEIRSGEYP